MALALAGCGDGAKPISVEELPPKLAESLCAAYKNCYGPAFDLFLNGMDCATITEQRILNGTFPLLQGRIDMGVVVYNGAEAQACLDSIAVRTCAQMLDRGSPACEAALDGTVALGGACILDEDCAGDALCKSASGTCPGQCSPLQAAGQACTKDDDCQDGLTCSAETRLCVHPASEGQACEYGAPPCGPGLLCLGKDDDQQVSGSCRTAATALTGVEGGPCDATLGQICQPGLSCVADTITLLPPALTWVCVRTGGYALGAACKPGFPEACSAGSYCNTGAGLQAISGTCATIPVAGQPCGKGMSECQPGATCVSGVCQNLAANGVSCTTNSMCLSEYCGPTGGCEARLPCR